MSDLTNFGIKYNKIEFSCLEGKLINYKGGVLPETYIVATLGDGYTFYLPYVFLGELDSDGGYITGEDKANKFIKEKILPNGSIDLTKWNSLDSEGSWNI